MIGFTKIRRYLRKIYEDQRGAVAAMIAVGLTAMVGMVSLSVDLGVVYTAKAELQAASDAAALAAANDMIQINSDGSGTATPGEARETARSTALANAALGQNLTMRDEDFTVGFWDSAAGDFDPSRTGFSSDPADLTAVKVTLRRDSLANSPVSTFFAGILGINTVDVRASSVAYIGFAGSVEEDTVDLPIVIRDDAISPPGSGPNCGGTLEFHSEPNEVAEWTSFFRWPANDPTVDNYVCDCWDTPTLSLGDEVNVVNGNLSNNTFRHLRQRFDRMKTDGEWTVTLPVIDGDHVMGQTTAEVVGFVKFTITAVNTAPYKHVVGYIHCGTIIPGSNAGGADFGTRASNAVLIR